MDFTDAPRRSFTYSGANGMKVPIWLEGEPWFLKLPPQSTKRNAPLSYRNSCVTEYLGCHVFELAGIPVQETRLGTYVHHGEEKLVVACRDFVPAGFVLGDFIGVKNATIDSPRSGHDTELATIEEAIDEQDFVDRDALRNLFWDMFVVDALIANNDRHNGNWGLLSNGYESRLAPVFDCGGCLFPDADENLMCAVLNDPRQRDAYVFSKPTTAIKLDGAHLSFYEFFQRVDSPHLDDALRRMVPRLDGDALRGLVDETPYIGEVEKAFYKTILVERKRRLLDDRLAAID